jgi:outer membrane protein assembly factor BamA
VNLPQPQTYDQTQWSLGWQYKKQRPYRWNIINPLDGFGVKTQVMGATDIFGTEVSYTTADLSAFTVLPGLGTQRFYLYGRAQAQFGDPLPQQRIGFTKYDNIAPAVATQQQPYIFNLSDRVRGYRSFIMGEQVLFGTLEYRSPFLPGLATKILGLVELGRTDLALFADAGWVGNVQFSSPDAPDTRLGTGLEVKNVLSLFGVEILQSVGWGFPYDKLFDLDEVDLYYRVRASVAF